MSTIRDEALAANAAYAAGFSDKGNLPKPPGRQCAVLTCIPGKTGWTETARRHHRAAAPPRKVELHHQ